jgi:ankyrin repeat protein
MSSQSTLDAMFIASVTEANIKMASALLHRGANIDSRDKFGNSALYQAFAFGRMPRSGEALEMVRFLLNHGADITTVDGGRATILLRASQGYGRFDAFKLLIEKRPDVNAADKDGNTALHFALGTGQLDKAALLLGIGADINKKNSHGRTPLIEMASRGHRDSVQFLLDNKEDLSLTDECGCTSLDMAASANRRDIVEMLIDAGADPRDLNRPMPQCPRSGKVLR